MKSVGFNRKVAAFAILLVITLLLSSLGFNHALKSKPPVSSSTLDGNNIYSTGAKDSKTEKSKQSTSSAKPSVSTSLPSPAFTHPAKYLVGYYGGWSAYGGYTPDKINASKINVINYAFAKIDSNLKITASDAAVDYTNFTLLQSLKSRYSGLKTVISVGGWDDSGKFSDAALTEASRTVFADSAVSFIKTYGFDGVDIDWEYPTGGGLSTNTSRSVDSHNFGLLLKTLRSKLDLQGAKDSKHYILSFAGAANSTFSSGVGLASIAKTVDYGFIMTYDLHGGWDAYTDFNASLFTPAGNSPQNKTSVDAAVRSWLANGFPASKMIMGVPFYGYDYSGTMNGNGGLWQHYSSCAEVGYDTIVSKYLSNTAYAKNYSSSATVPYLFNGSTFISYDDENSIAQKTRYAVSKGLFGVGAWDISYDRSSKLVNSVKSVLG